MTRSGRFGPCQRPWALYHVYSHHKPHFASERPPRLIMVSLALITEAFPALTPAQWCQAFFGISSASILAMQVIPKAAQHLLLDYGARSPVTTIITDDRSKEAAGPGGSNVFNDLVKAVASVGQIPHSWFMHFYIASVAGSALWAWQYLQGGSAITSIAEQQAASGTPSMSLEQTMLVWTLMALQGARRLHECLFVMKPGSSKMWFVHWLLGLGFYLCMSVSVWVDGSGESLFIDPRRLSANSTTFPSLSVRDNQVKSLEPAVVAHHCRNGCVRVRLVQPAPMPQIPGQPQEVFTAGPGPFSIYRLPPLYLRMPHLPGPCRRRGARGPVHQSHPPMRLLVHCHQPWHNS